MLVLENRVLSYSIFCSALACSGAALAADAQAEEAATASAPTSAAGATPQVAPASAASASTPTASTGSASEAPASAVPASRAATSGTAPGDGNPDAAAESSALPSEPTADKRSPGPESGSVRVPKVPKKKQEEDYWPQRTLLDARQGRKLSHGGFGGPELKLTGIDDKPSLMLGVKGAWLVDHTVFLGLGGFGLTHARQVPADAPNPTDPNLYEERPRYSMGYGGVLFGVVLAPERIVHANVSLLLGAGGVGKVYEMARERAGSMFPDTSLNAGEEDDTTRRMDGEGNAFFVAEPEVELEFNLTRFFRPALGVSYRYVLSQREAVLADRDLRGFAGSLALKFGRF